MNFRSLLPGTAALTCAAFILTTLTTPSALAMPPSPEAGTVASQFPEDPWQIKLDPRLGKIESVFQGEGKDLVIVVQDAHAIPEAQRSIEKIIRYFQEKYGLSKIGVEGAASALDPQIFKSFPEKEPLQQVFKEYYEKGELTGSAAAAIFSDYPSIYRGVEDWDLYEKGVGLYLEAMKRQPNLLKKLEVRSLKLEEAKQKVYSPELLKLDRKITAFYRNEVDLVEFLKALSIYRKPTPKSDIVLLLAEVSKKGESAALEIEVRKMAEEIKRKLEHGAGGMGQGEKEFNEKYQAFQTSRISAQEFALFLKELIKHRAEGKGEREKENPLPSALSPMLQRLAKISHNQKRLRDIEGTRLFRDIEKYSYHVMKSLFKNSRQAALHKETKRLQVLGQLVRLEIIRRDWESLKKILPGMTRSFPDGAFQAHEAFYENARARDAALLQNLKKLMKEGRAKYEVGSMRNHTSDLIPPTSVLLVAGGFHAQGLSERLKEAGISHLLIMPEIGQLPEEDNYAEQMQGNVSWKDYFEVENGRVSLYKAFVRGTRDRLLNREEQGRKGKNKEEQGNSSSSVFLPVPPSSSLLLKYWRDQIIRDLSQKGKIEQSGQYTRFLDEIAVEGGRSKVEGNSFHLPPSTFHLSALAKIEKFIAALDQLRQTGRLTRENVIPLLRPSAIPSREIAGALAPGSFYVNFSAAGLGEGTTVGKENLSEVGRGGAANYDKSGQPSTIVPSKTPQVELPSLSNLLSGGTVSTISQMPSEPLQIHSSLLQDGMSGRTPLPDHQPQRTLPDPSAPSPGIFYEPLLVDQTLPISPIAENETSTIIVLKQQKFLLNTNSALARPSDLRAEMRVVSAQEAKAIVERFGTSYKSENVSKESLQDFDRVAEEVQPLGRKLQVKPELLTPPAAPQFEAHQMTKPSIEPRSLREDEAVDLLLDQKQVAYSNFLHLPAYGRKYFMQSWFDQIDQETADREFGYPVDRSVLRLSHETNYVLQNGKGKPLGYDHSVPGMPPQKLRPSLDDLVLYVGAVITAHPVIGGKRIENKGWLSTKEEWVPTPVMAEDLIGNYEGPQNESAVTIAVQLRHGDDGGRPGVQYHYFLMPESIYQQIKDVLSENPLLIYEAIRKRTPTFLKAIEDWRKRKGDFSGKGWDEGIAIPSVINEKGIIGESLGLISSDVSPSIASNITSFIEGHQFYNQTIQRGGGLPLDSFRNLQEKDPKYAVAALAKVNAVLEQAPRMVKDKIKQGKSSAVILEEILYPIEQYLVNVGDENPDKEVRQYLARLIKIEVLRELSASTTRPESRVQTKTFQVKDDLLFKGGYLKGTLVKVHLFAVGRTRVWVKITPLSLFSHETEEGNQVSVHKQDDTSRVPQLASDQSIELFPGETLNIADLISIQLINMNTKPSDSLDYTASFDILMSEGVQMRQSRPESREGHAVSPILPHAVTRLQTQNGLCVTGDTMLPVMRQGTGGMVQGAEDRRQEAGSRRQEVEGRGQDGRVSAEVEKAIKVALELAEGEVMWSVREDGSCRGGCPAWAPPPGVDPPITDTPASPVLVGVREKMSSKEELSGVQTNVFMSDSLEGGSVAESFFGIQDFDPGNLAPGAKVDSDAFGDVLGRDRAFFEQNIQGVDSGIILNLHGMRSLGEREELQEKINEDGGVSALQGEWRSQSLLQTEEKQEPHLTWSHFSFSRSDFEGYTQMLRKASPMIPPTINNPILQWTEAKILAAKRPPRNIKRVWESNPAVNSRRPGVQKLGTGASILGVMELESTKEYTNVNKKITNNNITSAQQPAEGEVMWSVRDGIRLQKRKKIFQTHAGSAGVHDNKDIVDSGANIPARFRNGFSLRDTTGKSGALGNESASFIGIDNNRPSHAKNDGRGVTARQAAIPRTPELIPIAEVKPGDAVLSLNEATGQVEARPILTLLDMGVKPVYKLTTASGRSIKTTANHPYLVRVEGGRWKLARRRSSGGVEGGRTKEEGGKKWIKVSELKAGDQIAVAKSEDSGSLIGLVPSFDSFNEYRPALNVEQSAVVTDTAGCQLDRMHGKTYAASSSCLISSKGIQPFLLASAMAFWREWTKSGCTGSFASMASISQPAKLTDGSWYASEDKRSTSPSSILDKRSKRAKESKRKTWGTPFRSTITAALDLRPNLKMDAGTIFRRGMSFADFLFAGMFFIAQKHNSFQTTELYHAGKGPSNWLNFNVLLPSAYAAEPAEAAAAPGIFWDTIASLEFSGYEQVYDIEVQGTHNFIGNGIFAHNTAIPSATLDAPTAAPGAIPADAVTMNGVPVSLQGLPFDQIQRTNTYDLLKFLQMKHRTLFPSRFSSNYDIRISRKPETPPYGIQFLEGDKVVITTRAELRVLGPTSPLLQGHPFEVVLRFGPAGINLEERTQGERAGDHYTFAIPSMAEQLAAEYDALLSNETRPNAISYLRAKKAEFDGIPSLDFDQSLQVSLLALFHPESNGAWTYGNLLHVLGNRFQRPDLQVSHIKRLELWPRKEGGIMQINRVSITVEMDGVPGQILLVDDVAKDFGPVLLKGQGLTVIPNRGAQILPVEDSFWPIDPHTKLLRPVILWDTPFRTVLPYVTISPSNQRVYSEYLILDEWHQLLPQRVMRPDLLVAIYAGLPLQVRGQLRAIFSRYPGLRDDDEIEADVPIYVMLGEWLEGYLETHIIDAADFSETQEGPRVQIIKHWGSDEKSYEAVSLDRSASQAFWSEIARTRTALSTFREGYVRTGVFAINDGPFVTKLDPQDRLEVEADGRPHLKIISTSGRVIYPEEFLPLQLAMDWAVFSADPGDKRAGKIVPWFNPRRAFRAFIEGYVDQQTLTGQSSVEEARKRALQILEKAKNVRLNEAGFPLLPMFTNPVGDPMPMHVPARDPHGRERLREIISNLDSFVADYRNEMTGKPAGSDVRVNDLFEDKNSGVSYRVLSVSEDKIELLRIMTNGKFFVPENAKQTFLNSSELVSRPSRSESRTKADSSKYIEDMAGKARAGDLRAARMMMPTVLESIARKHERGEQDGAGQLLQKLEQGIPQSLKDEYQVFLDQFNHLINGRPLNPRYSSGVVLEYKNALRQEFSVEELRALLTHHLTFPQDFEKGEIADLEQREAKLLQKFLNKDPKFLLDKDSDIFSSDRIMQEIIVEDELQTQKNDVAFGNEIVNKTTGTIRRIGERNQEGKFRVSSQSITLNGLPEGYVKEQEFSERQLKQYFKDSRYALVRLSFRSLRNIYRPEAAAVLREKAETEQAMEAYRGLLLDGKNFTTRELRIILQKKLTHGDGDTRGDFKDAEHKLDRLIAKDISKFGVNWRKFPERELLQAAIRVREEQDVVDGRRGSVRLDIGDMIIEKANGNTLEMIEVMSYGGARVENSNGYRQDLSLGEVIRYLQDERYDKIDITQRSPRAEAREKTQVEGGGSRVEGILPSRQDLREEKPAAARAELRLQKIAKQTAAAVTGNVELSTQERGQLADGIVELATPAVTFQKFKNALFQAAAFSNDQKQRDANEWLFQTIENYAKENNLQNLVVFLDSVGDEIPLGTALSELNDVRVRALVKKGMYPEKMDLAKGRIVIQMVPKAPERMSPAWDQRFVIGLVGSREAAAAANTDAANALGPSQNDVKVDVAFSVGLQLLFGMVALNNPQVENSEMLRDPDQAESLRLKENFVAALLRGETLPEEWKDKGVLEKFLSLDATKNGWLYDPTMLPLLVDYLAQKQAEQSV